MSASIFRFVLFWPGNNKRCRADVALCYQFGHTFVGNGKGPATISLTCNYLSINVGERACRWVSFIRACEPCCARAHDGGMMVLSWFRWQHLWLEMSTLELPLQSMPSYFFASSKAVRSRAVFAIHRVILRWSSYGKNRSSAQKMLKFTSVYIRMFFMRVNAEKQFD